MIKIGELYARYASTVEEAELHQLAEQVFVFVEGVAQDYDGDRYTRFGIRIRVELEVGSTRLRIGIFAASALSFFISYGSIRQSIDYARKDIDVLARAVFPYLPNILGIKDVAPEYHARRIGVLGELEKVFKLVEKGELNADAATKVAMSILARHAVVDAIEDYTSLERQLMREFTRFTQPGQRYEALAATGAPYSLLETEKKSQRLPQPRNPMIAPVPGSRRKRRRKRVVVLRDANSGNLEAFEEP